MSNLEELEQKLVSVEETYEKNYAGKDRNTVSVGGLDELIGQVKALQAELDKLGALTAGDNAADLGKRMQDRLATYERERGLVGMATEMGEGFERFSIEGAAANFVFDRYQRHFAGQSRDTRDLGLLKELVEELRQIKKRMTAIGGKKLPEALARDVEIVEGNITRYQVEEREIPRAHAAGTLEEQADRLAALANAQFAVYQGFFAGQSRVTRRPQMLVRIVENLKRYRSAMFDLKNRGLTSESNNGNIGVIDGRLKAYETELGEIRKIRREVKLSDIMGSLGGSANELFQQYRDGFAGKDRTSVDLVTLHNLIDKLDEIRRQMEELGRVEKNDMNIQNQRVVREYQVVWVQEFQAILAAQSAAQATKATPPA